MPRFAAVVPVSSKPADARRLSELIATLVYWEPELAWCVIVDDSPSHRDLLELAKCPATCEIITLLNPRCGRGFGHSGGLFVGIAAALSWIYANTDAEFIVKVDSDALVIGRFASYVSTFLNSHDDAGVIGALGCSCNLEVRAFEDLNAEPELLRAHRRLPTTPAIDGERLQEHVLAAGLRHMSLQSYHAFRSVRPHIVAATKHGYVSDENCQGGAYVIARRMLDRMVEAGYLVDPAPWAEIPVGEDRIMAMYASAVELRVLDCSRPGQPFGVQSIGLPYPPSILVELGYSLTHSVKSDAIYNEEAIVAYFRGRRSTTSGVSC